MMIRYQLYHSSTHLTPKIELHPRSYLTASSDCSIWCSIIGELVQQRKRSGETIDSGVIWETFGSK
jgi:hypothetical protein